jgi:hypothetical protein
MIFWQLHQVKVIAWTSILAWDEDIILEFTMSSSSIENSHEN